MENVKKMIEAGTSIPTAIKEALMQKGFATLSEFADKKGLVRNAVANHLNGSRRPTGDTIRALVAELGGTDDEWRELLWLAGKPEKATVT